MKQIDWSKAPEGATHYQPARGEGFNPVFWRVENDVPVEAWAVMGNSTLQHIPKPSYIDDVFERLIPRPTPQWSGEGLPPVGTVCEYRSFADGFKWQRVEILLHVNAGMAMAAVFFKPGTRQVTQAIVECFRPIRTPEQIAAEERESHVLAMLCHDALGGTRRGLAEALYDAGYRKVEQGK